MFKPCTLCELKHTNPHTGVGCFDALMEEVGNLRARLEEAEKIVKSGGQAIHDLLQQLAGFRMALEKIAKPGGAAAFDPNADKRIAREALEEE